MLLSVFYRQNMPAAKKETKKKAVTNEVVTREYTINVHKRIHGMYVFHCVASCYCDSVVSLCKNY